MLAIPSSPRSTRGENGYLVLPQRNVEQAEILLDAEHKLDDSEKAGGGGGGTGGGGRVAMVCAFLASL